MGRVFLSVAAVFLMSACQENAPAAPGPEAPVAQPTQIATPTQTPTPAPVKKYSERVSESVEAALKGNFRNLDTGEAGAGNGGYVQRGYCAPGVDCHSKFVSIGLSFRGESASCSGVLISDDLVLTNRHCITPVVKSANLPFAGVVAVGYPQPAKDSPAFFGIQFIANLVALSPSDIANPVTSPDWAILKLSSSFGMQVPEDYKRPVINRSGFKSGETYYVYSKPAYADAPDEQMIEKRACKAIGKTVFAPWFDRPILPVVMLADCPIGPGNSGSPIYNEAGELVGIIGGQFDPWLLQNLSNISHYLLKNLGDQPFQPMGWGMPLACIPDFDSPLQPLPADCDAGPFGLSTLLEVPQFKKLADFVEELESSGSQFRYQTVQADMSATATSSIAQPFVIRAPECLKAGGNWSADFELAMAGHKLSPYGELMDELSLPQRLPARLQIDRALFDRIGIAPYTVMLAEEKFGIHTGVLKRCPNP